MPKVLRIMHRLSVSGPTLHAHILSNFAPDDYETLIVTGNLAPGEAAPEALLKTFKARILKLESMGREVSPLKDMAAVKELRRIIRDFKPDVVHTHAAKSGAVGRLAARLEGVPVIVHTFHGHVFHSYFGKAKTTFFILLERMLARLSTNIITISEKQHSEITGRFRICAPSKARVIPLGFDLSAFTTDAPALRAQFRDEFALPDNALAIGTIGRLTEIKNQKLLIDVAVRLKASAHGKDVRFFIVGGGNLEQELKDYANASGLSVYDSAGGQSAQAKADLYFTGWRMDTPVIQNGLDVFALTSLNEGTPVTVVEAHACSKPVVSTNVGGVGDIVTPNVTGLLTPSGDVEAFAGALEQLVSDDALRDKMGKAALSVSERFTHTALARNVFGLYDSLLKGKIKS